MLSQPCQAVGICKWLGRRSDYPGVARQLAFKAKPAVHPAQRRIKWKERNADLLQQIDPVIAAAEVFALMQHNLLQIGWRKLRKEPLWYEKARRKEADHAGRIHIL
jgi:hypothetical protein